MTSRSFLRVVVTAAVASATFLYFASRPVDASAAQASGSTVEIATHNIWHTRDGGLRYVAAFDRPLMMMGQEVCAQSLLAIQADVGRFGYEQSSFRQVVEAEACNRHSQYTSAWTLAPTALVSSGRHPGGTPSGWACIVGSYGSTWRSCSTHMTAQDPATAYLQSENFRLNVVPPSGPSLK